MPNNDYILYVSIFDIYKNQLEVVRGFSELRKNRPTLEKLVLAGYNDSSYGAEVKREISRLGLEDKVILPGNVPHRELPAVYQHAKINLFASECENCPNILLEAMGAGRPLSSPNTSRCQNSEVTRLTILTLNPQGPCRKIGRNS